MTDWITWAEQTFTIRLKKVGRNEYAGPCPWCQGKDRFRVWERGNYFCRPGPGHCGRSGWLDELDEFRPLTDEENLRRRVEALEHQQQEMDRRLSVLERMAKSQDHLRYHANLKANDQAADYWYGEGFTVDTVDRFLLGYCPSCPTCPGVDSYTIPVMAGGTLYNIRHRLARETKGGKYRPHVAGLPAMLYNVDDLRRTDARRVAIVEGEKKAIMLAQEVPALPVVGIMGKQAFKPGWARKFLAFPNVLVLYDPDGTAEAQTTATLFGKRGRVVSLPVKADDFFRLGGTAAEFSKYLTIARPVQ